MAFLGELGQKYPVAEKGVDVPLDDQTAEMFPGDILEAQYTSDRDLNADAVQDIIHETLRMKEQYPGFVLHYLKFETRKITAQFSVAPMGGTISSLGGGHGITLGLGLTIVLVVAALAAIIVGAYAAVISIQRQIILRPPPATGDALAIAKDSVTKLLLPNVPISTNGMEGTTGPNGEGVSFEDLLVGDHVFVGGAVEGYQAPKPVTKPVIEDKLTNVTIWYDPEGHVPPTHGWLSIDTSPIKAKVWVGGTPHGETHVVVEVLAGDHIVSFDAVEGWIHPEQQTHTVQGGETEPVIGYYTKPSGPWYEKYIMYALIGGGAIIAAAVLVPELIKTITRRGPKQ